MKSFDEWFNTYENLQCDKDACEDAYEAGAASRQGEIDKIKSDNQLSEYQIGQACAQWREIAEKRQVEVDELQKQLEIKSRFLNDADEANKYLSNQVDGLQKRIDAMQECMDDAIRLIDEGNSWDAKELLK